MWNIASEFPCTITSCAPTSYPSFQSIRNFARFSKEQFNRVRANGEKNKQRSKNTIVDVDEVCRHDARRYNSNRRSKSVRQLRIFFSFSFNFINSTRRFSFLFFFLVYTPFAPHFGRRCFRTRLSNPRRLCFYLYRIAVVVVLLFPACKMYIYEANSQPNAFSTTTHMAKSIIICFNTQTVCG